MIATHFLVTNFLMLRKNKIYFILNFPMICFIPFQFYFDMFENEERKTGRGNQGELRRIKYMSYANDSACIVPSNP